MILELITMVLIFTCCWPIASYTVQYLGWKYPEYHRVDLYKIYSSIGVAVVLMIILTIEMAKS
jgi:hypothetical protein